MTKLTMILTVNGVIIGQALGILCPVIAMICVSFAPDLSNFVTVVFLNQAWGQILWYLCLNPFKYFT